MTGGGFPGPRRGQRPRLAIPAVAVAAMGALAVVAVPATPPVAVAGAAGLALVIEDAGGGPTLHREAVRAGDAFVLAWVHSSEHVPVRGTFVIDADGMVRVVETAFAGFGPGLPELRPGDDWRVEDGLIVHRPSEQRLPALTVRVVPITRHRLRLPSGRELDLSATAGAGRPVRIRVE